MTLVGQKKTEKDTSVFEAKKMTLLSTKSHFCLENVTSVPVFLCFSKNQINGRKRHFCFVKCHFCSKLVDKFILLQKVNENLLFLMFPKQAVGLKRKMAFFLS